VINSRVAKKGSYVIPRFSKLWIHYTENFHWINGIPLNFLFRANVRVLVPGAGLGRIVYEIVRAGYQVEGNELEFSMLMASNLALNRFVRR
jgi:hypothetical protein